MPSIDQGLNFIFKHFNDEANKGNFADLDEILKLANPEELSLDLSVGFLTATYPMRNHLKERDAYMHRCWPAFIKKAGPERTKRLLRGLENTE